MKEEFGATESKIAKVYKDDKRLIQNWYLGHYLSESKPCFLIPIVLAHDCFKRDSYVNVHRRQK